MIKNIFSPAIITVFFTLISSCKPNNDSFNIAALSKDIPHIPGTTKYLNSPYVTAGNRVYMVGYQDGSFPEIGWHIKGEMGGIWNHPIKLMDGFSATIIKDENEVFLKKANSFVNFAMANKHIYKLKEVSLNIERYQFVPDNKEGISIQYILQNTSNNSNNFTFNFNGASDLLPTWLGEKTKMIDGEDKANYLPKEDAWLIKDDKNPWFTIFGSDLTSTNHKNTSNSYKGKGSSNSLEYQINLEPNETKSITFFIAGSYKNKTEALATFTDIKTNYTRQFIAKKNRYKAIANNTKLTIPDKELQTAFEWLKYNCDWLVRTVPEIGTGITAGLPDYPWWFGVDSEYALKGYMAIGQTDAVYKTIQLLDSVSNAVNGNGKIIHEMSTNGYVFNKGNINETPQFTSLIWEVYQWNGDKKFLQKYFPSIKKGLHWLMQKNDANKNLFPDGFGMMEIHGMDSEMIDVASYTQRAFDDAAKIADILGESSVSDEYNKIAASIKEKINSKFWSNDVNSYADFIGTDTQALHLIEDALIRADTLDKPWAVKELKQTKSKILQNKSQALKPFVVHHNWVVNTPLEMKIADSTKAIKALNKAKEYVNPFGVFVTGIDRDASAGSDSGSFKGSKVFSYTGAVMTLPTGVQAVSENNYGRPDEALNYLERITRTFSYALPGSIYEVSPDYGMFTQAWNIYAYAIPIVQQFFGVQPQANIKTVTISPQMPSKWNDASLENIKIADNTISVYYLKTAKGTKIQVTQTDPSWTVKLALPKNKNSSYTSSNKSTNFDTNKTHRVYSFTGTSMYLDKQTKK